MTRLAPAVLALALPMAAAAQGEIRGMPDPPGTGARFPGAVMIHYEQRPAEAFVVLTGPAARDQKREVLDGKLVLAVYRVGGERSPRDVAEAYEGALKDVGFEILFRCGEEACGGWRFNAAVAPGDRRFLGREAHQQYIAARKTQEGGHLAAQLYAVRGDAPGEVFVRLLVIEAKDAPRQQG